MAMGKKLVLVMETEDIPRFCSLSIEDPNDLRKLKLDSSSLEETFTDGCSFISTKDKIFQVGGYGTEVRMDYSKAVYSFDSSTLKSTRLPNLSVGRLDPVLLTSGQFLFVCSIDDNPSTGKFKLEVEYIDVDDPNGSWFHFSYDIPSSPHRISYDIDAYFSTPDFISLSVSKVGSFLLRGDGFWRFSEFELPFIGEAFCIGHLIYAFPQGWRSSSEIDIYRLSLVSDGPIFELLFSYVISTGFRDHHNDNPKFLRLVSFSNGLIGLLKCHFDHSNFVFQVCVDVFSFPLNLTHDTSLSPLWRKKYRPGNTLVLQWFLAN